ncbi:MAG: DUF2203 domain-containing protein [Chloroflexota bacterium]
MPSKYFTVDEANAVLKQVEPLVAQLVEKQAQISTAAQAIQPLLTNIQDGVASQETSNLVITFSEIEALISKIQAYGCIVKNANVGLLDFLADFNGRDIYLCWKHGEDKISFYHDIHDGFNGRKPII